LAQVSWTHQALDDLEAICLFIARDAPGVAAVFAQKVFETTDRLEMFPQLGRVMLEIGKPAIREIILGNYRIIYRIENETIDILTVHHSAQLLKLELDG